MKKRGIYSTLVKKCYKNSSESSGSASEDKEHQQCIMRFE